MRRDIRSGTRIQVPTVQGDRRLSTYATYIGPDVDNEGYHLIRTDDRVMGEHDHSLLPEDIAEVEIVTFWRGRRRITAEVIRSEKDASGSRFVTVVVDDVEITKPAIAIESNLTREYR